MKTATLTTCEGCGLPTDRSPALGGCDTEDCTEICDAWVENAAQQPPRRPRPPLSHRPRGVGAGVARMKMAT